MIVDEDEDVKNAVQTRRLVAWHAAIAEAGIAVEVFTWARWQPLELVWRGRDGTRFHVRTVGNIYFSLTEPDTVATWPTPTLPIPVNFAHQPAVILAGIRRFVGDIP